MNPVRALKMSCEYVARIIVPSAILIYQVYLVFFILNFLSELSEFSFQAAWIHLNLDGQRGIPPRDNTLFTTFRIRSRMA